MSRKALAKAIINDICRMALEMGRVPDKNEYLLGNSAFSEDTVSLAFGSYETGVRAAGLKPNQSTKPEKEEKREPKILLFDLETSGILARVFGIHEQRIGINQIVQDWTILSFAAKFLNDPKIIYVDTSKQENIGDDRQLLSVLRELLVDADVVVTQNGRSFDEKVANARLVQMGFPAIPKLKHLDTLQLSRGRFKFTSHKLEYMAKILDVPCKKLMNRKFIGMELWNECMAKNPEAWAEMKEYNCADVMALEGVYLRLRPWATGVDLNPYYSDNTYRCQCGSTSFLRRGFSITNTGKFQRFQCKECDAWHSARGADNNYMSGKKKASLKTPKA